MSSNWFRVCFGVLFLGSIPRALADDCLPPTVERCLSPSYIDTCGAAYLDACRSLVADEFIYQLGVDGRDPLKFFLPGGVAERVRALSPDLYPPLPLPPPGPDVYNLLIPSWTVDPTVSQHFEWEQDGYRINSCREYVYKKYYDYNRLEDAIKAYGDNYEAIYRMLTQGAGDIPHLDGRVLKNREGTPLPVQPNIPGPGSVKNPFFTSWAVVVDDLKSMPEYSFDPEFGNFVDNLELEFRASRPYGPYGDPWAFHRELHWRTAEYMLSPQASAYIDQSNDRYQALVQDFVSQKLYGHGADAGSGFCDQQGRCDLSGLRQAIIEKLTAEINRYWLDSCLNSRRDSLGNPDNPQCDWTPRQLATSLVNLYPEREVDLARCVDITGARDDFDTQQVPTPKRVNLATFEAHLLDLVAERERLRATAPWLSSAPHPHTLGTTRGHHQRWAWDPLGVTAGYDYDYGWSVWVPTTSAVPICQLGAAAYANGDVWANTPIGNARILDTSTSLDLNPGGGGRFQSHALFNGNQLYQPIDGGFGGLASFDHQRTFSLLVWDRHYPLLGFDVHVNMTASATVGMNVAAEFTPGLPSCNPDRNNVYFSSHVQPSAAIDVSTAVGVGILVELGVEGGVNLFSATLPFDASARIGSNQLDLSENGKLVFRSGGGRVDIFAKVCLIVCEKARKNIGSWEGVRWEAPISSGDWRYSLAALRALLR